MDLVWDFALRLFLAGVMGILIGLEREYRAKEAGYRTHFLVALGSALMMIVSQYGFTAVLETDLVRLDPSRIAAQVVSGIGHRRSGGERNRFYRGRNHYFTETDCKRVDYGGRHLGHFGHRACYRCRHVWHRDNRYHFCAVGSGSVEFLFQEYRLAQYDGRVFGTRQGGD